jgi:hypothetical protein
MSSTDVIRALLREQKRECAALHANPTFCALRTAALRERQAQQWHQQHAGEEPANFAAPPAAGIDDLDAEALMRLFQVINNAAIEGNKPPLGVFAPFGKPYAPNGAIVEVGA